eukprot:15441383-Alexandrium_andersonii.AAC.1
MHLLVSWLSPSLLPLVPLSFSIVVHRVGGPPEMAHGSVVGHNDCPPAGNDQWIPLPTGGAT